MNKRAVVLADRIEQGAKTLATFAEGLSDAEWKTIVPKDGRTVGVLIHHVASVYPIEIDLARSIAARKAVAGVTWDVVAQMNAQHSHDQAVVGKKETIELLLMNGKAAADAVRKFSDEELDNAAPFSLSADAPMTAQFVIEDHALRHSTHHLAKIRTALKR
jgi:hypothetical protein